MDLSETGRAAADAVHRLVDRWETLATAESLTGGLVAATIVEIPGVSAVYRGGLVVYAAFNIGLSQRVEAAGRSALSSFRPTMVVANPQPLLFWRRRILWRNAEIHGSGSYDFIHGLRLAGDVEPNRLGDPMLKRAAQTNARVRAILFWSRMPIVMERGSRAFLTDQRFADRVRGRSGEPFLVPLD